MEKTKLEKLASERSLPCVTISMNSKRMVPNHQNHFVELDKLLKEAKDHVANEFGQHDVKNLLGKIDRLGDEIDTKYLLESLHIFLSDSTTEIVKSSWPIPRDSVAVSENFVIKPLIKDFNRIEEYLILVLSQSDVRLVKATNDKISEEIKGDDFPFVNNSFQIADHDKSGDGKQNDIMVREFFNQIDKAVVKIHYKTHLNVVVVCTDNNWGKLLQVADLPSLYLGKINKNFSDTGNYDMASDAWQILVDRQEEGRAKAIREMQEAASQGKVLTDLKAIYRAVKEGRGELLITHDDYHQAVIMNGQDSFKLAEDLTQPDVIDDITSDIAWEVISKKGRAIFTNQDEFKALGNIALKVRY